MSALSVDERIERATGDVFWIPEGVHHVEQPDLSYIHSARPQTFYNVVTRTRPTDARAPEMIAEVEAAHEGRRSSWRVTNLGTSPALLRGLERAGYTLGYQYRTYAVGVDELRGGSDPGGLRVERVDTIKAIRDALAVNDAAFGKANPEDEEELRWLLEGCADPKGRVARFVVYAGETPIASAGLSLFPELRFGFLWAGGTRPKWRGRGAYRALLKARAEWAGAHGIEDVGLYARLETSAPIVRAVGFRPYGVMDEWERPAL